MENLIEPAGEAILNDLQKLLELQQLYNAAIKEIQTKLEILNDEFKVKFARNPIHHVESRLKSTRSIINKLRKKNMEVSIESAKANLNDIAGIRIVCCYIDDVYRVADMLLAQSDIELIKSQDYIKSPNFNGYRSLHLDLRVPVFLSERTEKVTVEVQLRTVAMDFWASLEHDLRYKSDKDIPASIGEDMLRCANEIAEIDAKMQSIYQQIQKI
ncbi:MAG: GTP pyrophosphokinase family protein [Clostridia bacterium]|nr:GTP pyrophosphokinase family protein [Clostridia bacterium]